jgi:hypothetical protein
MARHAEPDAAHSRSAGNSPSAIERRRLRSVASQWVPWRIGGCYCVGICAPTGVVQSFDRRRFVLLLGNGGRLDAAHRRGEQCAGIERIIAAELQVTGPVQDERISSSSPKQADDKLAAKKRYDRGALLVMRASYLVVITPVFLVTLCFALPAWCWWFARSHLKR